MPLSRHLPFRPPQLKAETAVRVVADTAMVSAALLIGLVVRIVWLAYAEDGFSLHPALMAEVAWTFAASAVVIIPVSLLVLGMSGVYAHVRNYRQRYKALVVAQAVSLSYFVFAFLAFLLPDVLDLPVGAMFAAWLATLLFLISARVWADAWKVFAVIPERISLPGVVAEFTNANPVQKVLVIGGAGYIGSALLPRLLNSGYQVRLLDSLLFGPEPIASVIDHPGLEIVRADFRHVDQVVRAMRGMDAAIHLGAIVGDPACALNEDLTIDINLRATRMIAEVAKGSGIDRFIFASTCSVYGASEETLDERSALNPVSLYARSKIACEQVLSKMADDHFAPVILRFGTVYGLSGRTRFDLVVNLLTAKAVVEGNITVFGGDQWRPFLHVDDAALAVFQALNASRALVSHQVFNVGSEGQNHTIEQVGRLIQRLVPSARLVDMGTDGDRRNYRVSFKKIRSVLGYTPRWTLEQGVRQVIEAITSGRVQDYQEARYSNAKYLQAMFEFNLVTYERDWVGDLLNENVAKPERSLTPAESTPTIHKKAA